MAVVAFGRHGLADEHCPVGLPRKGDDDILSLAKDCPFCGEPVYTLEFEDRAFGVVMRGHCELCGVRVERFLPGWRSPARAKAATR